MRGNISPDKTRFYLSLRTKTAREFKALAKALGLPPSFMSSCMDSFIISLLPVLQAVKTMKDQGGVPMSEAEMLAALFQGVADTEKDKDLQLELFGDKP